MLLLGIIKARYYFILSTLYTNKGGTNDVFST